MDNYFENWAIQKILASLTKSAGSIPSYISVDEGKVKNHLASSDLKRLDEEISDFGFTSLGVIHLNNGTSNLNRDMFQKMYLNDSGETMCCLSMASMVGLSVPYIEFISETSSGIFVVNVVVQSSVSRSSLERDEWKVHRTSTAGRIDIKESYLTHVEMLSEFGNDGFKSFTNIGHACEFSRVFYARNLISLAKRMCEKKSHVAWYFRIFISNTGYQKLQSRIIKLIGEFEAAQKD